jgi:hypothetical protein
VGGEQGSKVSRKTTQILSLRRFSACEALLVVSVQHG